MGIVSFGGPGVIWLYSKKDKRWRKSQRTNFISGWGDLTQWQKMIDKYSKNMVLLQMI
jgi:hypothetical protein